MKPIVVRIESGRLGNQLFQYAAMRSVNPRLLFMVGFEELFSTFSNVQAIRIPASRRQLSQISRIFEAPRSFVSAIGEDSQTGVTVAPNRLFLYCSQHLYFQSDSFSQFALDLKFIRSVSDRGTIAMQSSGIFSQDFLVVHVRGMDYHHFPSATHSAVLPTPWIIENIRTIQMRTGVERVVILGDDERLKEEVRVRCPGSKIISSTAAVDLFVMSHAVGGVLSASTFAWWGSAFARSRNGSVGDFVAPTHWFGHRLGKWLPESIRHSEHLTFVPVWDRDCKPLEAVT